MGSVFGPSSNIVITGGTFNSANDSSGIHYYRLRESANLLHQKTATSAFHNCEERFDPPKCHPNTRLAVLSEIMRWIKWGGDLNSFVMWVYGPAGAGKSAIAQTIAEMCEKEMILLASFFFSRNDPSRSNVKPLIATIAYQITSNLPDAREAVLGAIECDPLIFSKSLAVQLKTLIVEPLQHLIEAGFFNKPTSRRLVIIDGLDECSDPEVQRNIVEVLADAHRQHRLPLIFLFASRPEQHISLTFSTGFLPSATTRIAVDDSYHPDEDIKLYLTDKFQEITSTHRMRAYIPPQWPPPDILTKLVQKSSGQFIYASTVIKYVSSIRHKPQDRLDIALGIYPPKRDLPFAELDALYTHILADVEGVDSVLEILSFTFLGNLIFLGNLTAKRSFSQFIEKFLSLRPGDVELYLGYLPSLVDLGFFPDIRVLHASFTDFLMDPTRSKQFWINPPAQHTVFARRCLQVLQLKEPTETLDYSLGSIIYHCERAEITPELRDELMKIAFNNLQDLVALQHDRPWHILYVIPRFLRGSMELSFPEAGYIFKVLQFDFDNTLRNTLAKYHSFPGFALLLGGLIQHANTKDFNTFPPDMIASLYLGRQQGEGYVFDDTGFSGLSNITFHSRTLWHRRGTLDYLFYFAAFLVNPGQSGARVFDRRRYETASKECLQLCLCNHPKSSRGAVGSVHRDKVLRRSKPFVFIRRLGVHSRIKKGRHELNVRQLKSLKAKTKINQYASLPHNSRQHEFYRYLSYRWSLHLLPFFLKESPISLELVEVLDRCTFTTMAQKFPRRMRLAKKAIAKYLSRVEESGIAEQ